MPDSSFFKPIVMGDFPVPGKPNSPTYVVDPRLKTGYKNIFGTQVGVNFSPLTQTAGVDFQFPIGDHQSQLFLGGGAYAQPGTGQGSPSDFGVGLKLTKKIPPTGISGGEAIDRVLRQNLGNTINASTKSELFNTFTPEQLRILGQGARQEQRRAVDAALGIVPGAEKYSFYADADFQNVKRNEDGSLANNNPEATGFAKQYAKRLNGGGSLVEPNTGGIKRTPGINPEAEPKINPYTGEYMVKRQPILY